MCDAFFKVITTRNLCSDACESENKVWISSMKSENEVWIPWYSIQMNNQSFNCDCFQSSKLKWFILAFLSFISEKIALFFLLHINICNTVHLRFHQLSYDYRTFKNFQYQLALFQLISSSRHCETISDSLQNKCLLCVDQIFQLYFFKNYKLSFLCFTV